MALLTQKKLIGDYVYHTTQLPTSKARPALVRVQRVLLPVISEALGGSNAKAVSDLISQVKGSGSVLDVDISGLLPALGAGLRELAMRLEEDDLAYLCEVFGEVSQVEKGGKVLQLTVGLQETHFMGKLSHMMKWLTFCIQVNFADFLGDGLREKLLSESQGE